MLRELKTQLEKARQKGQRELPAWVQEDERFRLLLKQAEKQVSKELSVKRTSGVFLSQSVLIQRISKDFCVLGPAQTQEEQLQEKRVEKMMRAAAKDVHKIRGQSRKEVPEVQTFRWGTAETGGSVN